MIPAHAALLGPGAKAEQLLFAALTTLGEDWFVYHRLHFLGTAAAAEGEADFLVLHRTHGLLVIECKGLGVTRSGTGEWHRTYDDGRREPLPGPPMAQAQRHVHILVAELKGRWSALQPTVTTTRLPFVHGHSVAFPRVLARDLNLPLEMPRVLVFDASDLAQMPSRILQALAFWAKAAQGRVEPLSIKDFARFRRHCLYPSLNLAPALGADIAVDEAHLARLSTEQVRVVDSWLGLRRFRVKGGAGTGKTVLAVEVARRMAQRGADVLLLCFNIGLGELLAREIAKAPPSPGRVTAMHFHELCQEAARVLGQPFAPPQGPEADDFWREVAPGFLLEALAQKLLPLADALVVDEGQDFDAAWWVVAKECLREPETGALVVFFDPAQDIFGRGHHVPELPTLELTWNFRNTQAIARSLKQLVEGAALPLPESPEGMAPECHDQTSPSQVRRLVGRLIERLTQQEQVRPDQIAVLTPRSRKNSSFAEQSELGGHPLTDDPYARQGAILHTTIGKFKGLESDVVILVDIDPDDPHCHANARYVAASRARHRLHVCSKSNWLAVTV